MKCPSSTKELFLLKIRTDIWRNIKTKSKKYLEKDVLKICASSFDTHLPHFSMDIEARITQLRNLLGQQFNSLRGVTENDRLVYLKLSTGGGEKHEWENIFTYFAHLENIDWQTNVKTMTESLMTQKMQNFKHCKYYSFT